MSSMNQRPLSMSSSKALNRILVLMRCYQCVVCVAASLCSDVCGRRTGEREQKHIVKCHYGRKCYKNDLYYYLTRIVNVNVLFIWILCVNIKFCATSTCFKIFFFSLWHVKMRAKGGNKTQIVCEALPNELMLNHERWEFTTVFHHWRVLWLIQDVTVKWRIIWFLHNFIFYKFSQLQNVQVWLLCNVMICFSHNYCFLNPVKTLNRTLEQLLSHWRLRVPKCLNVSTPHVYIKYIFIF